MPYLQASMDRKKTSHTRKTHKKSRTGCRTCLRRHIRCDERKPRCKNCAYRAETCNYPSGGSDSQSRQLQVVPAHQFYPQQHGTFSPEYPLVLVNLETSNRNLLHHISSISFEFQTQKTDRYTILQRQLPLYLAIGYEYDFVQQALLGLSATHLEWMCGTKFSPTSSPDYCKGQAIRGLRQAINGFSKRNSDALLAASLLLLWQSYTPDDWSTIESGIGSLTAAMQDWEEDSILKEHIQLQKPYLNLPPSLGRTIIWKREKRDLERLEELYQSLDTVSRYLQDNREEARAAYKLLTIIRQLQVCSPTLDKAKLFEYCQPIRTYVVWTPLICGSRLKTNPMTMVFLAHVYATAVVMGHVHGLSRMSLDAGSLSRRSIAPIYELYRELIALFDNENQVPYIVEAMDLIQYPLRAVQAFQNRIAEVKRECNITLPG
ncbi:hypothetical protein PVAG01_00501 [Phlyctema vagabunda]|uniref:Zn(2)-C6 fungal-type domain-containing protein n=1 Tax=Phlyctema vagabunda TaxID=108571 RepID=A0ABR4PUE1_9HELO